MRLGPKTICAPPVEDVGIEEIIVHHDYKNNLYNDIALIRLNRKVEIQSEYNNSIYFISFILHGI